jgi:trans-aconitate methyltransferase
MDFGCGTGSTTTYLSNLVGVESILGIDTSAQSLEVMRQNFGSKRTERYVSRLPLGAQYQVLARKP